MDYQLEERRRRIEELRRKHAKGESLLPAEPDAPPQDLRDPDAPLISTEVKEKAARFAGKAANASRQHVAALAEKAKDAQERLRVTAERLAQRNAENDLGLPKPAGNRIVEPGEPEPTRPMPQWPSRRLWEWPQLALAAGLLWLAVGVGMWLTHDPAPRAQTVPAPIEQVTPELPTQDPGVVADPVVLPQQPQVVEAPARERTGAKETTPTPSRARPSVTPVPRREPAREPVRESAPSDQWTDEANAELDEWERKLREQ